MIPHWKCICGWTGKQPVIAYEPDNMIQPIEIFCPVNCGKEPSFTGTPEELTAWWNEWYGEQS